MKKTSKSILIVVTFLSILLFYFFHSTLIIQSFLDYSTLFLTKLFPACFIFFLFSHIFLEYGIIEIFSFYFHWNTSRLYVFLFSLMSGFPSGAKYTEELFEKDIISEEEGNQILLFSHFPNPFFVMGSVSQILLEKTYAFKILLALFLSNLLLFVSSRKKKKSDFTLPIPYPKDFTSVLKNGILDSFQTILLIYGNSVFFYLISVLITKYVSFSPFLYVLIGGIFDLTNGIFLTTLLSNTFLQGIMILFFISFGGISIHMQVKSILADSSLSYFSYLKGRVLGTILSLFLFLLFLILF